MPKSLRSHLQRRITNLTELGVVFSIFLILIQCLMPNRFNVPEVDYTIIADSEKVTKFNTFSALKVNISKAATLIWAGSNSFSMPYEITLIFPTDLLRRSRVTQNGDGICCGALGAIKRQSAQLVVLNTNKTLMQYFPPHLAFRVS